MRKTKIVCTMGPSTDKPGILRQLMENGMNVARFNFSHGDYEEHKGRFDKVRALSKELDLPISCMLDTKGPEIRLGEFKNGAFRIAVKTGVPVVPVAITGARALFENNGNRCHPGRVHICILPPIRTAGMSKAEQKQLPEAVRQTILAKLK